MEWAKNELVSKLAGEVKESFNKFDIDGSGSIDKDELAQLSKDLGYELSDY